MTDQLTAALRAVGCVFAEDEAAFIRRVLGDDDAAHARVVAARGAGVPLEHALGEAEYDGLRLLIEPGVFVPRPRTQLLLEAAVAIAPRAAIVVDLGTGCGALAAALAHRLPAAEVMGTELDPVAASVAAVNGLRHRFRVGHGSWWEPLPQQWKGRVELAVGYLPHVPDVALQRISGDHRRHEPTGTVAGGADGLDPLRSVQVGAATWLAPHGQLLVLVQEEQLATVQREWSGWQVLATDDGDLVVGTGRGGPGRFQETSSDGTEG